MPPEGPLGFRQSIHRRVAAAFDNQAQSPQTEDPPLVTVGLSQEKPESPVSSAKPSGPITVFHGGSISPLGTKVSKLTEFKVVGTRCKNSVSGY